MSVSLNKQQALEIAWRKGLLYWKLDPFQKELYKSLHSSKEKVNVVLSSRRNGKTYAAAVIAIELCLKKPGSIIKFLAPTKLMINNILRPLFREILEDCPEDIKPQIHKNNFIYYFPNGSELQLAGSDSGHAEKLRGSFADLCVVDEAGFCSELQNIVRSILIPTTMNTKGKILLISTPPKDLEHDFLTFVEEAEVNGTLIKKTIYDNPRIKQEDIDTIISAYPKGEQDPEFRREFLCEIQKDSTTSVIPEFNDDLEAVIVKEWPKPPYYDSYVSMDLGGKDLTVILYGYYDFRNSKIIIEDEIVYDFQEKDNTLKRLITLLLNKESELYTNMLTNEIKEPYLRISDINKIVTQEIHAESQGKLYFQQAKKDDKDSALNNLRSLLAGNKIIIHPKCKTLIRHLKNVKWKSSLNKSTYARSADGGHYDAVDALVYMVRHLSFEKNPYPLHQNVDFANLYIRNPDNFFKNPQIDAFKKIFNIKKR